MANISGDNSQIIVERNKNRVEISPVDFGWIWGIEYGDSKIASSIQLKVKKLPQEKLYQLWQEANRTIPKIRDSFDFHQAGRDLISKYLSN